METLHKYLAEYKKQLEQGSIQKAYKGLMDYLLDLKAAFQSRHPDYSVSGSLYFGYMDMSYFSVVPESLKKRGLKIAVVFIHETFKFEAWLSGVNKQVQERYWTMFKESDWQKYRIVPTIKGFDSILEHTLIAAPDFSDLNALTAQIERETLVFINDIEGFFSTH